MKRSTQRVAAAAAGLVVRPAMTRSARPAGVAGFSLIEVLISVVLLAIGLLGLAALQSRAAMASIEAYQRTQALLLARDIAERIVANKPEAIRYLGDDYGAGVVAVCPATPRVDRDLCDWANALRGASEQHAGQPAGTLTGGRGCIRLDAPDRIRIVVTWQGLQPTTAPATDCSRGRYANDAARRAVVLPLPIASLPG
jgi:type IV pilus assembly protein PilV